MTNKTATIKSNNNPANAGKGGMMTDTQTANTRRWIKQAGYWEIEDRPGVYIQTMAHLTAEQEEWADDDEIKAADFSDSAYWVTTDNGVDPEGFDTIEEAMEWVAAQR